MSKKDILFNEYQELTVFRERSIHSIESSANGYTTFFGFLLTALTILISNKEFTAIKGDSLLISIIFIVGFLFFLYGLRVFKLIYISHENLVIYTRKLNITRDNLIKGREKLRKMVLLPVSWKNDFDKFGHHDEKFSEKGVLGTVKYLNSLIFALEFAILVYLIIFRIVTKPSQQSLVFCASFIISIIVSIWGHNIWIKKLIKESIDKWNCLMKNLNLPEYQEK